MIDMQRQVLYDAAWKEKEQNAQMASLDLLYKKEVENSQTLSKQLSQLKEQSGMEQVHTCAALGSLCLCCYLLTVTCVCLCFH